MSFSLASWVLSHPQNVEMNEELTLRNAALLRRGEMRSGTFRVFVPPVRRAAPAAAAALAAPAPAAPAADDDDDENFGGGGGDDWAGPEPEPFLPAAPAAPAAPAVAAPAVAPAAPAAAPILSAADFARSQIADQPRLPWAWQTRGLVATPYVGSVEGKWWSVGEEERGGMNDAKRRDFGHIGRIMETELGVKLGEGERCSACQNLNQECWVYTDEGRQQVSRPGDTCARCRVAPRPGGCSLSKRKQARRRGGSPPPPGPRSILPKGPGGPPPGMGGMGVAA